MENKIPHCLMLTYPVQGHINPMLQFSKRLLHQSVSITFVVPKNLSKTLLHSPSQHSVSFATISDGFDDAPSPLASDEAYITRFSEFGSRTLRELMQMLADSGRPVGCLVYDPFLRWALPVAKEAGSSAAAFFTQSCAVSNVYRHVYSGDLRVPLSVSGEEIRIPGLPSLRPDDMPSFVGGYGSYPHLFDLLVNQFIGVEKADWLFFNTFYELEQEVIDYMARTMRVKTIGPTIPSMYLDEQMPDDREYGLNMYKPMVGACIEWLNQCQPASVIYVSIVREFSEARQQANGGNGTGFKIDQHALFMGC